MNELTSFNTAFMLAIGESREAGAKAERARIIALISEGHGDIRGCCTTCDQIVAREEALIALIKGDNK